MQTDEKDKRPGFQRGQHLRSFFSHWCTRELKNNPSCGGESLRSPRLEAPKERADGETEKRNGAESHFTGNMKGECIREEEGPWKWSWIPLPTYRMLLCWLWSRPVEHTELFAYVTGVWTMCANHTLVHVALSCLCVSVFCPRLPAYTACLSSTGHRVCEEACERMWRGLACLRGCAVFTVKGAVTRCPPASCGLKGVGGLYIVPPLTQVGQQTHTAAQECMAWVQSIPAEPVPNPTGTGPKVGGGQVVAHQDSCCCSDVSLRWLTYCPHSSGREESPH